MEIIVKNPTNGDAMLVDSRGRAQVKSTSQTKTQDATDNGYSFNINTGTIGLTSTTASGVFYFKNDESPINGKSNFIVDAIAVGFEGGTTTGAAYIKVIKNPTGGTLISGATAVDMAVNRNFGSSNELSSNTLAYKGAEGLTVTGGTDAALFYETGTRGYYTLDLVLPKGSSLAITIDPQVSAGTRNVYVALIGHREF